MSQATSFQCGDHTDDDLCKWNMDVLANTPQNDQDCTTTDASPHRSNEKKNKVKSKKETKETSSKKEIDSHCATDDETGEGSEQSSNKDLDIDVSFQEEDEETEKSTEEEEWFEYIKPSSKEAEEHMKKTKILCWTETHRRMKLEDGRENCITSERKMDKQNIRLAPWSRQQNQNTKMIGKTTSMIS